MPTSYPTPAACIFALEITSLLLAIPVVLFFVGFFPLPIGLAMCAAMGLLIHAKLPLLRAQWRELPRLNLKIGAMAVWIFLLATIASLAFGYGGVFNPHHDASKFIFIFNELLKQRWPLHYTNCELPDIGCSVFMRYYLGYFLLPAGIGKLLGIANLNWPILLVNTVFFASLLTTAALLIAHEERHWVWVALAAAMLFLFGDLDTLYAWIAYGSTPGHYHELLFGHRFERFSTASLIRWTPQCAIPAIYSALFFAAAFTTRRVSLAECSLPFLIVCVWSVLVAVGFGFLLLLYALTMRPPLLPQQAKKQWALMAAFYAGFGLLLLLYYRAGSGQIPLEVSWPEGLWQAMAMNLGGLSLLCLLILKKDELFRIALPILAALILLSVCKFGLYNDLGRYGSAPLLLALRLLVLKRLLDAPLVKWKYIPVAVLLLICALDGINALSYEGVSALRENILTFTPDHDVWESLRIKPAFARQYFAPCEEGWLSVLCE